MTLHDVALTDRYDLAKGYVQLTGAQAIVRLALMQSAIDRAAGHRTAGYVSGYRGSPLGGLDQQFGAARDALKAADIVFQPGLNEDLAATALWGAQQAEMRGEGRYDGVFGIWYGKGPGVDRSGDALRHANLAGTSPLGGVIALMGDDHTCESSTTAHQSEFAFVDAMIPILSPAGVQEIIDLGLHGWAMSRFAGTWVGIKCVKDTVESTSSVDVSLGRFRSTAPNFAMPEGGLNIRTSDHPNDQEARLHEYKIETVLAYAAANRLDRLVYSGGKQPRIGVVAAGKSYLDVLQALADLGVDEAEAHRLGLRLYKPALTWPLEPAGLRAFAEGLETIVVVEEKRPLIENQIREILYDSPKRPVVVGKRDEAGKWLLPSKGALDTNRIAAAIGARLPGVAADAGLKARLDRVLAIQHDQAKTVELAVRQPYFCAGCPHNTSTRVPEGSRAYAGIGCHYMSQWMERGTEGYTHMGGEGANWIGEAPFSRRGHVFQNMGDGTYNHSGYLAIRAAKAAGVTMTYKILFNDAVAMTGGQRHEGGLTVDRVARQVDAEGAVRIAIVSDDPERYDASFEWPADATIHHRAELDTVQRELREIPGLSVIIYDQTCAAEKRRRRKRGTMPDPERRVFINELVCEGCGDCGVKSNCVAVVPLETEFGRKRTIDQSACNKDFSCLSGFCPSFVTVDGGTLRKPKAERVDRVEIEEPRLPPLLAPIGIVVTGVGGTGVVTIGALIAMAAHLEGKGCAVIDMAGLAQKGGAVVSHIKLAPQQSDISAVRVAAGSADLVLGGDLVVAGSRQVLASMSRDRTTAILNLHRQYPGQLSLNPDLKLPVAGLQAAVEQKVGAQSVFAIDATEIATRNLGDAILSNVFLLGFAWQKGVIPLTREALERAIAINGASVDGNLRAFHLGRMAAEGHVAPRAEAAATTLDAVIARRATFLADYQDRRYAQRYEEAVGRLRDATAKFGPTGEKIADAAARGLFKLMAYKDEYEVARLYSSTAFLRELRGRFEGATKLRVHLAPPGLTRRDPNTNEPSKISVGMWILPAFHVLTRLRGLRGTPFDPFGYAAHRRRERNAYRRFLAVVHEIADEAERRPVTDLAFTGEVLKLMRLPEAVRGYGHVKDRALDAYEGALETSYRNLLGHGA